VFQTAGLRAGGFRFWAGVEPAWQLQDWPNSVFLDRVKPAR